MTGGVQTQYETLKLQSGMRPSVHKKDCDQNVKSQFETHVAFSPGLHNLKYGTIGHKIWNMQDPNLTDPLLTLLYSPCRSAVRTACSSGPSTGPPVPFASTDTLHSGGSLGGCAAHSAAQLAHSNIFWRGLHSCSPGKKVVISSKHT